MKLGFPHFCLEHQGGQWHISLMQACGVDIWEVSFHTTHFNSSYCLLFYVPTLCFLFYKLTFCSVFCFFNLMISVFFFPLPTVKLKQKPQAFHSLFVGRVCSFVGRCCVGNKLDEFGETVAGDSGASKAGPGGNLGHFPPSITISQCL